MKGRQAENKDTNKEREIKRRMMDEGSRGKRERMDERSYFNKLMIKGET